jgi:aquaporin Z
MKKYLVEFIGTFIFFFTIASVVLSQTQGVIPAIAIGFALMIVVYAGGGISGGHYNPAVSLAVALRGGLPTQEMYRYWIAQIFGASVAAALVSVTATVPEYASNNFNIPTLVIGEFIYTFALCYVVLLTTRRENSYFGLAIGSTVTVGAFAVGAICLAAFNPAVAIGLGITKIAMWKFAAITIAINLIAAAMAARVVKLVENN